MNREELMKKTKEQLVKDLLNAEYEIKRQEEVINDLNNYVAKVKIDEFFYQDYLDTKELLKKEQEANISNNRVIDELNSLLERYKHLIDVIGFPFVYESEVKR